VPMSPPLRLVVLLTLSAPTALLAQGSSAPATAVKLSGYLQARETYQENVGLVGTINRARLAAAGSLPQNLSWRLQGEFRTGNVGTGRASVSLQDAYIRWTRNSLGIQIGQFKTPFTREFVTSLAEVETADRSTVVDSLAPKRDIGLMADYAFGGRATIAVGVFNGEGQNITANRDSSVLGVARGTVRPLPFLALGANVARYFQDSTRYGADLSVEAPWVILRGEYVGQHHDQVNGDDKGWYVLAAAPLRPWLQPVLKYEHFNRANVALDAQKNRAWTAGVNLFPWGRATRFTLEYVSRKIGDPGVRTSLGLAQVQVLY
jgi:phosphate-selective porin